jgi:hypothetical protein
MAILFTDGFDDQLPYYSNKYTSYDGSITASATGRTGNAARWNGGFATKSLASNESTLVAGFAFKYHVADTGIILKYIDNSTDQIYLNVNSSSQVEVKHGDGTALGTSTTTVNDTSWTYIEFKATINNSSGSYYLKMNGVTEVSGTNADTQNSGNAYANKVSLGKSSGTNSFEFDDYYLDDANFLGNIKVYTMNPTADSSVAWTPNTGTNYQCVDDSGSGHDSDSTYVSVTAVNLKDLYGFSNLSLSSGTIKGIAHNFVGKKTDTYAANIIPKIVTNSTEYSGTTVSLTTSYVNYQTIWETNPNTTTAWTYAEIDALVSGFESTSS